MLRWVRSIGMGTALTAVAVLVTLGLVAGGALAQTPTPTPSGKPGDANRPAPSAVATDFFTKLAGKLGLSTDRVTGAAREVQKEQIDEAVKAGRLTAEQAARLKARVDAGEFILPFGARGGGPGHGRGPGGPGGIGRPGMPGGPMMDHQALATWLGITPETLRSELNGKSLTQVAQAHSKTRDQLIAFLTDQVKTRLDKAVTDGKLTREQADKMLEQFKQNVGTMVDRVHTPGQPGGPRGQRPGGPPSGAPTPRSNGA